MLKILEPALEGDVPLTLDELAREGARRMLMEATPKSPTTWRDTGPRAAPTVGPW